MIIATKDLTNAKPGVRSGMPCSAAPGELFVEWDSNQEGSPFEFIAELCNDAVGYIPTFEAFLRGGYESTPIVSVRSTPALGQMVADANFRNVRKLFELK